MGHRRYSAPRRGSLAFVPRVRTKNIIAKTKSWPKSEDKIRILGFAGYKVGMTHVIMIEDLPGTPMFGREIVKPVTIIETPPLYVVGLRVYSKDSGSIISSTELWAENPPKTLERVLTLPKNIDVKTLMNKIETKLSEVIEIRLIVCTQPHKSGMRKKTPEIFEIKIDGGNVKERYEFAKKLLGSEINIKDIFKEGQYVDVISVSKGKGFQGVIKRYGVKVLGRWHKHRKGSRKIGSIGPGTPSGVMWTVPRPGQLGFHQRTEYNKRILKIGMEGGEINTSGGFKHYGIVKGSYIIIEGSIPGPPKRLIKIRFAIRRKIDEKIMQPKVIHIQR